MPLLPTNSFRPVIGAFVAVRKDWEWTQWTLVFFAIFSWLTVLPTRETYKKTILERRRVKLGLPAPPSPFPSNGAKLKFLLTVTLLRPLHMLFTESIVGFLSIYIAFNFGVLFTFFAAFPYVFGSVYHFTTEQSGLVFLALGIGCLLAVPTVLFCDRFLYAKQFRLVDAVGRTGAIPPEHRLYPAMLGSFGLRKSQILCYLTSVTPELLLIFIPSNWSLLVCMDSSTGHLLGIAGRCCNSFCLGQSLHLHCLWNVPH